MADGEMSFVLPIGYEDENGNYHRNGIMMPATALIEIEVNRDERVYHGSRFRDCLMLSKVITKLGSLNEVTFETIENMYETDFIYLQLLFNRLNTEYNDILLTYCPECGNSNKVKLSDMYKVMHNLYASDSENRRTGI